MILVQPGQSFAEALNAEVRKRPPPRYVVCVVCSRRKRIAEGDICRECKDKADREKKRRKY